MMVLIPGARAFVVTACWWRARCKGLRSAPSPRPVQLLAAWRLPPTDETTALTLRALSEDSGKPSYSVDFAQAMAVCECASINSRYIVQKHHELLLISEGILFSLLLLSSLLLSTPLPSSLLFSSHLFSSPLLSSPLLTSPLLMWWIDF